MRREEWQTTQEEMISTALVDVFEPGDRLIETVDHDVVMLSYTVFEEFAKAAGFTNATT